MPLKQAFTLVITGVAGAGKSTVARLVAQRTDSLFLDADDFHPAANREKMSSGTPLDDSDRAPWLAALRHRISAENAQNITVVLACSALKQSYRDTLREAGPQVAFVHLRADRELLLERLASRSGHFFPAQLLDTQLKELEPPVRALTLNATASPEDLATQILVPFFNRLP